tara:strand:- start:1432 stop:1635 length:204 start_codon:yes stop_codon:yes gene_type:complete
MSLSLHLTRIIKDVQGIHDGNNNNNNNNNKKKKEVLTIEKIKELSPKTIRRNLSNDNFLKFQWPWTV